MDHDTPDAAAVIAVAKEATEERLKIREVDPELDYVVVGPSGETRILDLSSLLDVPEWAEGTYRPATVESFVDYVETHKDDEHTTVWVHPTEGRVLAVLDDNAAAKTAWRRHRAELTLLHSEEWKFWTEGDGDLGNQQDFAEKLQEGLPDIAEPAGAELLEIAQTIQGTATAKYRSGKRLKNGATKMEWDESVDAKGGEKGDLEIPDTFTLMLAPFIGNEKVPVVARFRYRIHSGRLSIGYKLEQPERIVQDALEEVADTLGKKFKRVYRGQPA